jgi:hypothetical protein
MNTTEYYNDILNNPLTAWLNELPVGDGLVGALQHLPPVPDAEVRAKPMRQRLALLSELKGLHVCLGRDRLLVSLVIELIRDGLAARRPSVANIVRRRKQVTTFTNNVVAHLGDDRSQADVEAIGGALIGISGMGKTRTLKRILRLLRQVITFDVAKNPSLPTNMVTHIRAECPSNRTIKALIESIFAAIEAAIGEQIPASLKRGSISVLVQNIGQVCSEIYLGVLIIDEVQHALRPDGLPEPQLLNFFVELSNTLQVPIILVGTPLARQVVGRQMRQARRMLGPEWSNLKWGSVAYKTFIESIWPYQYTRAFTPYEGVAEKFYELSQGVPALAIALFRHAQSYVIHMESDQPQASGEDEPILITNELLQAVSDDLFQNVHPMVLALHSGDPDQMSAYEDLKFDAEALESTMLDGVSKYREQLRIKLLRTATLAARRARKIVRTKAVLTAERLAETPITPSTDDPKLLKAYKKAVDNNEDPGRAVANAA